MERMLDTRPARQLTDREITKIIGGLIGGLLQFNRVEDVETSLRFLVLHFDTYADSIPRDKD